MKLSIAFASSILAVAASRVQYAVDLPIQDTSVTSTAGQTIYLPLNDTSAKCLDGSQYGFFLCKGANNANWTINIQGGGWCYNEVECLERAATRLGSSETWPAQANSLGCWSGSSMNYVNMFYGDGASFTGYREQPWPVPGTNASLWFRGIRNLDATLDALFAHYGMDQAELIVLTGGSAGGLSTFLHLDHVAERASVSAPAARVVGEPVCGFFLDHGNDGFAPANVTYPLQMQYVYNMQNSTGSLSTECQSYYGEDAWKCIMAPHAAPFIKTPWFALQSRFDHWQLAEELFLPCMQNQPYTPPYNKSTCTPQEDAAIQSYGPDFWAQFSPLITPGSKNGVFLDACIIHGSTNSTIDGKTNSQAFWEWVNGGQQWYIMQCNGSNSTGPCDPSPICAPFP